MNTHRKLTAHDWRAGFLMGAALGAFLLGIGGRVGMRVIAISEGRAPAFTLEGSIAVTLLGLLAGTVMAALFLLSRALFPANRFFRSAFFWIITALLVTRGLSPLTPLSVLVFAPLFLMHGGLLHTFWCRIHWRRAHSSDRVPTEEVKLTAREDAASSLRSLAASSSERRGLTPAS